MYAWQPAQYVQKWLIFARAIYNSSVIKDFFTYSCGAIFLRTITLFLAPIILQTISPEEYGMLALINSFIAIVSPVVGLGLRQVLTLEYFHCAGINRRQLVNEIIIVYVCLSTLICTFIYAMRMPLQHYLLGQQLNEKLLLIAIAQTYVYFFVELLYQLLSYERKTYALVGLQMSVALITISCSLLFVLQLQWGIAGILAGQCVGSCIAFFFGTYCYYASEHYRLISFSVSAKKIAHYIQYGLPFLPGMIFAWLLASGNRWFLAHYGTLHDVGIYAITDTFAQLFQTLILLPWSASYLPYILTSYAQNRNNILVVEQRNHMIMYIVMICLALTIICAYMICTPLLIWLLPVAYHPAIEYIWPLLMGYVFLFGSYFASSLIQFHKKNYFLSFALCIPAVVSGVLNSMLIPHFGLYGCTGATIVSYAVYFIIVLGYNYRLQRQINLGTVFAVNATLHAVK